MKTAHKKWLSVLTLVLLYNYSTGQTSLGSSKIFLNKIKTNTSLANKDASKSIALQVSEKEKMIAKINYIQSSLSSELLIGEIPAVVGVIIDHKRYMMGEYSIYSWIFLS